MAPNRLVYEKSPYLLQHAHNPVDWHAWSDETFAKAKAENKPIFLSIGYATCHWCHVMEKESFEDGEVARHLNETFVSIKVDREERPDIDAVYMAACQMLTGSGGWPLNLFMTADKEPFFAATYLPKHNRFGRAGLIELCQQVKTVWQSQPEKIHTSASGIAANIHKMFSFSGGADADARLLDQAFRHFQQGFDSRFGGFEPAPKFPSPHRLLFLLRYHHRKDHPMALDMVERTLQAMRLGGIWDHIGFGFHRYATDKEWLLPHFEKMLYDQALIAQAYLETYQVTENRFYAQAAHDIFTYVLRDMTSAEGGFFSAEDADSEGEEGKFYVWSAEEFRGLLGDEPADMWQKIFNVQPEGNFLDEASRRKTGANILHLTRPLSVWSKHFNIPESELIERWERIRRKIFDAREKRVHPLKDDKILADWNGLMIAALAMGGRVLGQPRYSQAAQRAASFALNQMRDRQGRLFHRFRDGELAIPAQASDYAYLIYGLLHLYQATFELTYAEQALSLADTMLDKFWDHKDGGFFLTAEEVAELPVRPKELYDGAIPSSNSVALFNLLWLGRLTGSSKWHDRAQDMLRAFSGTVQAQPAAFSFFLLGLDFALHPDREIVITGEPQTADTRKMLEALNLQFSPNQVTLFKSDQNAERMGKFAGFTDGLQVVRGQTTAHMCQGYACQDTTSDAGTMLEKLMKKAND